MAKNKNSTTARKLRKKEVISLAKRTMDYYKKFPKDVMKTLFSIVGSEKHVIDNDNRLEICKVLSRRQDLVVKFSEKYCALFQESFKGLNL